MTDLTDRHRNQKARDIVAMLFWRWNAIMAEVAKMPPLADKRIVEAQERVAYETFTTAYELYKGTNR